MSLVYFRKCTTLHDVVASFYMWNSGNYHNPHVTITTLYAYIVKSNSKNIISEIDQDMILIEFMILR